MYARPVHNWTLVSEALPNDRATAVTRSAKAHAVQASEEGSTVRFKLNCPAWPKPCAEDLLETGSEGLLKIPAAAEIAVFRRLWGFAADGVRRAVLRPTCPRRSVRSRSMQIFYSTNRQVMGALECGSLLPLFFFQRLSLDVFISIPSALFSKPWGVVRTVWISQVLLELRRLKSRILF